MDSLNSGASDEIRTRDLFFTKKKLQLQTQYFECLGVSRRLSLALETERHLRDHGRASRPQPGVKTWYGAFQPDRIVSERVRLSEVLEPAFEVAPHPRFSA